MRDNRQTKIKLTLSSEMVWENDNGSFQSHPERISDLRGKRSQLNFTGIEFPVKLRDIDRFEKQNEGIAVNVFGLKGTKVYPLRISEKKNREQEGKLIIDLLMIKEEGNQHYCLIKIS